MCLRKAATGEILLSFVGLTTGQRDLKKKKKKEPPLFNLISAEYNAAWLHAHDK